MKIIVNTDIKSNIESYSRSSSSHVYAFDAQEREDGMVDYVELYSPKKLTKKELQNEINIYLNKICDEKILSGFRWNVDGKDVPVWLSLENQFNYKALYDMAVQTNGESLPTTIKIGTDDKPEYVTFSTIDEFKEFTQGVLMYIQECIAECWRKKGNIDYDKYEKGIVEE